MTTAILTLTLTLSLTSALISWAGELRNPPAPVTLLEKAVQKEEIEHDWETAAQHYLSLCQPNVPAAIRLEAEIRLARCQLKLGKSADAEKSLLTLVERLRGERAPDADAAPDGKIQPDAVKARLESAMKEIESSSPGVDRARLVEAAIDGMARTMSTHSAYINPQDLATLTNEVVGVGAVLAGKDRIMIKATVPGSPAEKAGILPETEIVEIDGKSPFALGGKLEGVVKAIRGPVGSSVKLRLKFPGGELKELTLQRSRLEIKETTCTPLFGLEKAKGAPPASYWLDEAAGIAGIALHSAGKDSAHELQKILAGPPFSEGKVKGFILDLSDNGGGYLDAGRQIADTFLKEGVILSQKQKDGTQSFKADAAEVLPGVPMVVLVNRNTASSAEIITAALQDNHRATVIGERTYGRGEIMTVKNLPEGGAIKVPVGEMIRPSGKGLEKREGMTEKDVWGITPDVPLAAKPGLTGAEVTDHLRREAIAAAQEFLKIENARK